MTFSHELSHVSGLKVYFVSIGGGVGGGGK